MTQTNLPYKMAQRLKNFSKKMGRYGFDKEEVSLLSMMKEEQLQLELVDYLYQKIISRRIEILKLAETESIFHEKAENHIQQIRKKEGELRRPVFLAKNKSEMFSITRRFTMYLHNLRDLKELDPERFPTTGWLMKSRPRAIKNVVSFEIVQKKAVDSRLVSTDSIIRRLNMARKKLVTTVDNKQDQLLISPQEQIKLIDRSISYLEKNSHRKIRLRAESYSDMILIAKQRMKTESGSKIVARKYRISELGIAVIPENYDDCPYTLPHERVAKYDIKSRFSYDDMPSIPLPITINGMIYWEDEILEAKKNKKEKKDSLTENYAESLPKLA